MSGLPPGSSGDGAARLHRCIRDLAALNALPSMCIGRSPDEALQIVLDALPTALSCEFVYLTLPGSPPRHLASLDRTPLAEHELLAVQVALASATDGTLEIPGKSKIWYYDAEVPIGSTSGRLVAGKKR